MYVHLFNILYFVFIYKFVREIAGTTKRILAVVILSVCPSIRLSVCHDPVPNQAQVR